MGKLIAVGGWGCSAEAIESFRATFGIAGYSLSPTDFEPTAEALCRILEAEGEPVHLLGWSLGAMLALQAAAQGPECVRSLSLCACGQRFTRRKGDRAGMRAMILERMRARLAQDPAGVLASFAVFMKVEAEGLLHSTPQEHIHSLRAGLEFLESFNFEPAADTWSIPTRIVHGSEDPVIPAQFAEELLERLPGGRLLLLPQTGHLPWQEEPQATLEFLRAGMQRAEGGSLSVARQFSRSAAGYAAEARIQGALERRLLASALRLPAPARALDIGCGTGSLSRALARAWPSAQIDAVDVAPGMIAEAEGRDPEASVSWHAVDFMQFEAGKGYDLVLSSATMQWLEPLEAACARIAGILKSDGRLLASVFLAGSLPELEQARRLAAPSKAPVVRLPQPEALLSALKEAGFELLFSEVAVEQLRFVSPQAAVAHLKKTGTTAAHAAAAGNRLTPRELRALYSYFEPLPDGSVTLSFQTMLIEARRSRRSSESLHPGMLQAAEL